MQVSVETTTGLERRITVGIPASEVDLEVNKRLQQASRTVKINGFRKGKVPLKVVKQRYGEGVRQEVLGDAINRSFYDAIRQESLRPAGSPHIEPKRVEEGEDIEYVATFEVYPKVELADLSGLTFTKLEAEIGEGDIDKMVENLRKSQGTWQDSEAAAEEGDRVKIDYFGKRDGEPFEGGSAEGHWLVLGSKSMIPGFEDGLVGTSAGDSLTLDLVFPEDYHVESLRSAAVQFELSVQSVQKQLLPEVDETFFEKFGVAEGGLEKFRAEVLSNMEREKRKVLRARLKEQVMDALLSAHQVDLPKALVDGEIQVLRNQAVEQYGAIADKIDVRSLLPDDMFREQAQRRTALGLIISEIVTQESLKADPERMNSIIVENASTYENPEEVVNYYYQNRQLLANVEAAALEDQVVDKLLEKATIEVKQASYEEVINQSSDA